MTIPDALHIPHATLITGPAGAGKTQAVIDAILDVRQRATHLDPVWVLLASHQQIHAFQARLIAAAESAGQPAVFGVECFTFEALYVRVLDLLGDPQRLVDNAARYQILRTVIDDLRARDDLELFGPVAHLPGFIGLLAGLIHELKQGLVFPDRFAAVAVTRDPKDRDIARIYTAYQDFLRAHRLVDRHGAGWLAVEHLNNGVPFAGEGQLPGLLVVDGFDQFNRVHQHLLTALARRLPRTLLTLTVVPGDLGRHFRRFEQTYASLIALGEQDGAPLWQEVPLPVHQSAPQRTPVLEHLTASLFSSAAETIPGDSSLALVEAPDTGREVSAVLRRVKRLLLNGTEPESILLVMRDLLRYSVPLRETARAYGVPLTVREGLPLTYNPAVALVLALIDLAAHDFPRRDLLDALRSPYSAPPGLNADAIAALERFSLKRQIVSGRAIWLEELRLAATDMDGAVLDEDREQHHVIDPALAAQLGESLAALFDRLTPPHAGTIVTLTAWIEALIGPDPALAALDAAEGEVPDAAEVAAGAPNADSPLHATSPGVSAAGEADFQILARVRGGSDPGRVARDITALKSFMDVLADLRTAYDLLGADPWLSWAAFRAELQLAVEQTTVTPPGGLGRLGRVLATGVHEARGLPHDHVFILGVSEGVFPVQESDNALYQEGERHTLEQQGIDMLTAIERADDMSLFYQAVGLARTSLTLSRFTVDERGTEVHASPYWRAVRAAVDVPAAQVERIATGATPALDEAATLTEAAIAVAAVWSCEHDPGIIPATAVHNALLERDSARWHSVLHGRAVESDREDPALPFDHFSGLLRDPALRETVAEMLGPDHLWSASQFNEYGECGFRFFAKRLLRLEELLETSEGLDQMQLGSLNHEILEVIYRRYAGERLWITPQYQERAIAILHEEAARIFSAAPETYAFRESPIWEAEQRAMIRRLEWLVRLDFSDETPLRLQPRQQAHAHPLAAAIGDLDRVPYSQEAAFGRDDALLLDIGVEDDPVLVRGVIDRVDRASDHLIVIDYKTGTTKHPVKDMEDGRDFQMMVYLAAADALVRDNPDLVVLGGLFWHIRNRTTSGEVRVDHPAVEGAMISAQDNVILARDSRFIVQPNGRRCPKHCEFRPLCRLNRAFHLKTDREGQPHA